MSIQVNEIAFVFYAVTDVARARKFYEELLGLKPSMQFEHTPGKWWIEYDIAGQTLAISNLMPSGLTGALALEVADLDAALEAATAAGFVPVNGVLDFKPCRMFQIRDLDGNEITLHQRKS